MEDEEQPIVNTTGWQASQNTLLASVRDVVSGALRSCLIDEQTPNKAPAGFDKALEDLHSPDAVSRAFLDAGFKVWYAYFLATDRNQSIKQCAAQLSPSALRQVATEVSNIDAHDSVTKRIQHVLFSSNRGTKRARLLTSLNVPLPSPPNAPSPDPHPRPSKRLRSENMQHSQAVGSAVLSESLGINSEAMNQKEGISDNPPRESAAHKTSLASFADSSSHNVAQEGTMSEIDQEYQYVRPKARNLPLVFPNYMSSVIVKRADEAMIMLSFPSDPTECHLTLDISASEVQYVAKELFSVHIRVANMRRFVVFEHGASIDINESITLRGAASVAVDRLFGQMVGTAFRQSARRMEEFSMGEVLSRSFSMKISEKGDSPARLDLMVQARKLFTIHHMLWQEGPLSDTVDITSF